MQQNTNRRKFVKNAGAAAGFMIVKAESVRGSQANSALTLGLIGCGNRSALVTGYFVNNESAKVTAICDIYDDKIEAALKRYPGAVTFKDYKDLLATGVDAVFIATPAFLHPEQFEAAVKARKHIFMETPVAVEPPGCRRIEAAAARADKTQRISVDYQQRYGADYRAAHRIVLSGELGD
ncbi:MAG: Gfo/Idh/MocA family oxidoreductase, partial [bacterium]|nr:Gfo/Idh/MocA family oxidoreductase [bacterium]